MTSPTLKKIVAGNLCAGCGGCAVAAPGRVAMSMTPEGFLRPVETGPIDAAAEARIAEICPGVGLRLEADGRTNHHYWGPVLATRRGYAADADLRHAASSGGALSGLLAHLLESGAVAGVWQTAAADAPVYANRTVISRSRADILAAAGSRYAPSAPLSDIADALERGERLAFVGKPCDVAALRALARNDARIDACFPYMLSFFCAGVPSQKGAEAVIAALGVEREGLAAFRFRGNGWPGFATATRKDGTETRMSYHDSWGGILTGHVQLRCRLCPDGTGGFADVVCADAWACDADGYPLFEEQEGQSLIVTRTAKGEALVTAACAQGEIKAETIPFADIDAMQPGQIIRKQVVAARTLALRAIGRPAPRYSGLFVSENGRRLGLAENVKIFLQTLRRALKRRI